MYGKTNNLSKLNSEFGALDVILLFFIINIKGVLQLMTVLFCCVGWMDGIVQ